MCFFCVQIFAKIYVLGFICNVRRLGFQNQLFFISISALAQNLFVFCLCISISVQTFICNERKSGFSPRRQQHQTLPIMMIKKIQIWTYLLGRSDKYFSSISVSDTLFPLYFSILRQVCFLAFFDLRTPSFANLPIYIY